MKREKNINFESMLSLKKAFTLVAFGATLTLFSACGGSSGGSSADTAAPIFSSSETVSINENQTSALTLQATDASAVTYEINSALFDVNTNTGVVTFVTAPNYEKQSSYELEATASDTAGNTATQTVTISILDVAESIGKFVITVKTDNIGDSSAVEFTIPTDTTAYPAGYNYNVDCDNDGENESVGETQNYTCQYDSSGTYSIAIEGDFPQIYFNAEGDKNKLMSIDQWGTNIWQSMENSFFGCSNLAGQASDNPNLSQVENMDSMFRSARIFDQNISAWDVSHVTSMYGTFRYARSFNQDIGEWDVANVTNMVFMFTGANSFNQNLSSWKVHNVTNMRHMFSGATAFDQNIGAWQPYAVTAMDLMFNGVTLSISNYRLLLEGWDFKKINLQNNVTFSGGNSRVGCTGIGDIDCLDAQVARESLRTDKGWTITDGES